MFAEMRAILCFFYPHKMLVKVGEVNETVVVSTKNFLNCVNYICKPEYKSPRLWMCAWKHAAFISRPVSLLAFRQCECMCCLFFP